MNMMHSSIGTSALKATVVVPTIPLLPVYRWGLGKGTGFSPVPCHPDYAEDKHKDENEAEDKGKRGKAPSIGPKTPIKWAQYRTQQPSEEQCKAWALSVPGLGAVLSGEFVVIDLDFNHLKNEPENRLRAITEMVAKLKSLCPKLAVTYIQKSGSGGVHIFVKVEGGEHLGTGNTGTYNLMWEGIKVGEIKKGFVVLAPSMHESGNRYEAVNGLCDIVTITLEEFKALGVVSLEEKQSKVSRNDLHRITPVDDPQLVLEQCLCTSVQNRLKGQGLGSDRSADLWAVATEAYGWEDFLIHHQIPFSGTAEVIIDQMGDILGYSESDTERKSAKAIESGGTAADEKGCWLRVKKLNPVIFEAKCPDSVKDRLNQKLTPLEAAKKGLPLPLIWDKKGLKLPTVNEVARYVNVYHQGRIAFHPTEKQMYSYQCEGGYWKILENRDAHQLVASVIRNAAADNEPVDAYSLCWAGFIGATVNSLMIDAPDTPERLPNHIIPFVGKWFDTKTKTWIEPSKNYFVTSPLPVFPTVGDYSRIHNWLMTSVEGNQNAYDLIRALFYLVLTGDVTRQVYFELVGVGGTGKSTLVELLELIVGKEHVASSQLTRITGNDARFELAKFAGKRLIYFPDQGGYGGSSDGIKALVGQDSVSFERKNDPNLSHFKLSGICVVTANKPVRFSDESDAVDRRRILVKFMHMVSEGEKAKYEDYVAYLSEHLPAWLDHILSLDANWMRETVKNRSTYTKQARVERFLETDAIAQWLDTCVVVSTVSGIKTAVGNKTTHGLYSSYSQYCANANQTPKGLNNFTKDLLNLLVSTLKWDDKLIYSKKYRNFSYIHGLTLVPNHTMCEINYDPNTTFNPITKESWNNTEKEIDGGNLPSLERINTDQTPEVIDF